MSYYIAPRFLNKIAVHITKNFLDLPNVTVPLILGIHGRKGEGKTFQCHLAFEQMGMQVVQMSAGELESPDAGDPARLIRLRYREAGEMVRVRGRMAVLLINDLDAGAGRVDAYTQYTVNTQLVHGTLMNIADSPTNVQLPGSYDEKPTQRIPIIVTGNDFATLYAPLIRDGRMEKFFWEPTREERIGIVSGIFAVDAIAQADITQLVDTFPEQALDFYSALRSRLYDEQVQQLIQDVGVERISARVVNSKEPLPDFRRPDFSLPHLMAVGHQLVQEQQRVQEMRLVEEYNQPLYTNRKLGDTRDRPRPGSPFYRRYAPESEPVPNGQPQTPTPSSPPGQASSTLLTPEMMAEINRILGQGQRLGIEYVDRRRFQTQAWQCYGTYEGDGAQAVAALENCLNEHPQDYVRLVAITERDRHRLTETIVQRP